MTGKGFIRIAGTHGFCSGVKRAVSLVEQALQEGPFPVRVLHEIVHNAHVVNAFRARGAEFHETLDPSWKGGTLIFSAHGVGEAVEQQAKRMPLRLIDATCPLVKQIHRHAVELESQGFRILFIGKRKHRETEGVAGRLKEPPVILETPEECETHSLPPGTRCACLTQTTLSQDECSVMIAILQKRFPGLTVRSGICRATQSRQDAVKQLAESCSRIIVIGDVSSSNSRRLREVAEQSGAEAILAGSPSEIPECFLERSGDIGLTGGASAPEYLLEETVSLLKSRGFLLPHD